MAAATAPVKFASRAYLIELSTVMGFYVAAIVARTWLLAHTADPMLGQAIKLMPVLPIWLCFLAVLRHYRRIDEYERLQLLKTLAIAFGITSCTLVSYSFGTDAGLPPLAITWAWPTLAVSWGLTAAILGIVNK
jgi:hypothetical protein